MHNIWKYLEKVGDKLGIGYGFHSEKLEQKRALPFQTSWG